MEIGIIGLGLIGGSLAKAISQNTDNTVYGYRYFQAGGTQRPCS